MKLTYSGFRSQVSGLLLALLLGSMACAQIKTISDSQNVATELVLPAKADPGTPTAQELWLSTTTANALKYRSGGTTYVVTTTSSKLSAFAATTSSELAGVISDETGSGALVFATSPTFVTPVLGAATATSLALTNGATITDPGTGALAITASGTNQSITIAPSGTGDLLINKNTTASTPWFDGALMTGADATNTAWQIDSYGAQGRYDIRRADGTKASPTALATGNAIGGIGVRGYHGTDYSGTTGSLLFITNGGWSASNYGTLASIAIVPSGQTTQVTAATFGANSLLSLGNNATFSAWTTDGVVLNSIARSYTNNTSTGTVAVTTLHSLAASTIAATSATTFTDAANLYIAGDVAAGTNVTLTNSYGLWNVGKTRLDGNVGIGGRHNAGIVLTVSDASLLSGTSLFGVYGATTAPAGITGTTAQFYSNPRTSAGLSSATVVHFRVYRTELGAGSTIAVQTGFDVTNGMTQGVVNYGFRGGLAASGTDRFNLFMDGTAPNSLAGELYLGSATDAGAYQLQVTGNTIITGSVTTGAPSGGTAAAWKFGVVSSTSPTAPDRTIELDVAGTRYFVHAKTTND